MYSSLDCFVRDSDRKDSGASTMPFIAIADVTRRHCNVYAPNFLLKGNYLLSAETTVGSCCTVHPCKSPTSPH